MFCGIAPMAAVTIYSVEGLAGLGGRFLFGVLADRLGVRARSGRRSHGAGACHQRPISGQPARRVLRAGRDLRHRLWRRDAALRGAGARIFRPAHHGHGVRRGGDGVEPGMASARCSAAGCSTITATMPGCSSARRSWASARSPSRSPSRRCRAKGRSYSRHKL